MISINKQNEVRFLERWEYCCDGCAQDITLKWNEIVQSDEYVVLKHPKPVMERLYHTFGMVLRAINSFLKDTSTRLQQKGSQIFTKAHRFEDLPKGDINETFLEYYHMTNGFDQHTINKIYGEYYHRKVAAGLSTKEDIPDPSEPEDTVLCQQVLAELHRG